MTKLNKYDIFALLFNVKSGKVYKMNPLDKIRELEAKEQEKNSPAVAFDRLEESHGEIDAKKQRELFLNAIKIAEANKIAKLKITFKTNKNMLKVILADEVSLAGAIENNPKMSISEIISTICDENGIFKSYEDVKDAAYKVSGIKNESLFLRGYMGIAKELEGQNIFGFMANMLENYSLSEKNEKIVHEPEVLAENKLITSISNLCETLASGIKNQAITIKGKLTISPTAIANKFKKALPQAINFNKLMFEAIENHDAAALKDAIASGADVNAKNEHGNPAILMAAFHGFKDGVDTLIENKSDVNATNGNGKTALMEASFWNNVEIVTKLLINYAKIDTKDNDGNTALHHMVSHWINSKTSDVLLDNEADPTALNNEGKTPIDYAVEMSPKSPIVKSMLEKASQHLCYADIKTRTRMIEYGANPDATNEWGTPLIGCAAMCGDIEQIDYLLSKGVGVDRASGNDEYTPLAYAVIYKKHKTTQHLLNIGANFNIKINGKMLIDLAKEKSTPEIVKMLENAMKVKTRVDANKFIDYKIASLQNERS